MTLRFDPIPYSPPYPTASQYADKWVDRLNDLGQTFTDNRRQAISEGELARRREQDNFDRMIQTLALEDKYGTTGVRKILKDRPAPQPILGKTSMAPGGSKGNWMPVSAQPEMPLDSLDLGNRAQWAEGRRLYGSDTVPDYVDPIDQDQKRRLVESEINKNNREKNGMTPEQSMRMEDMLRRRQEAEAKLEVPGYQRGNIRPTEPEAQKMRESVSDLDRFTKNIGLLQQYLNKYGSFELTGPEAATMKQTTEDIRLQAKNLYDLGVLNGRDYELISNVIPNTKGFDALFTNDNTRRAQYNNALRLMKTKVGAKMQSMGYAPIGDGGYGGGPSVGTIEEGYRFKGGNPADPNSWELAQ